MKFLFLGIYVEEGFLEKIRKNKISVPIYKSFKIEKWLEHLNENINIDDELPILLAGLVFHQTLCEIRDELKNLYKKENPFSKYEEIIMEEIPLPVTVRSSKIQYPGVKLS